MSINCIVCIVLFDIAAPFLCVICDWYTIFISSVHLVGVNGAGKSTTLGILTGDIRPTAGTGYIAGVDMQSAAAKLCLGLCPQEDPVC